MSTTSNPSVALFIGILATTLFQSSSTTTSLIVAMVGGGTITLSGAVPMNLLCAWAGKKAWG